MAKSRKSYLDAYASDATAKVDLAGRALASQIKQAKKNLKKF